MPPNVRVPRGRNFARDTGQLSRSPRYYDPYDSMYFGNPASPYFYLYLAALQDNDRANPVPYHAQECKPKKTGHSTGIVVLWAVLALIVGVVVGAVLAAISNSDY